MAVPATSVEVTFSFYHRITSTVNTQNPSDLLHVKIFDTNSAELSNVASLSNADRWTDWRSISVTLGAEVVGQTIIVQFYDKTDVNSPTSFFIDTVSVLATTCQ